MGGMAFIGAVWMLLGTCFAERWIKPESRLGVLLPGMWDDHELWYDVNAFFGRLLRIVGFLLLLLSIISLLGNLGDALATISMWTAFIGMGLSGFATICYWSSIMYK